MTNGNPAAIREAITALHEQGRIVTIDDHSHLTGAIDNVPVVATSAVEVIRQLGEPAWSAAKALAVLGPSGQRLPDLLAEVTGRRPEEMLAALERLTDASVVDHDSNSGIWRFGVPAWAASIASQIGPYERGILADFAIRMVTQGDLDMPYEDRRVADWLVTASHATNGVDRSKVAGPALRAARQYSGDVDHANHWHEVGLSLVASRATATGRG